jgi:DNA-binding HxlR family transcriptional regulator
MTVANLALTVAPRQQGRGDRVVTTERGYVRDDGDSFAQNEANSSHRRALLDLLATRWTALIIDLLQERGETRFTEVLAALPGVGPKTLTRTLRRLQAASLIERTVHAEVPPRVEYALTDIGVSLAVPLREFRVWAEEHADDADFLAGDIF